MNAEALIEKCIELKRQNRHEEALIAARGAVAADGDDANAWWQLCVCSYNLGKMETALEAAINTTDLAPGFPYGWARRGTIEIEVDDEESAINSFRESLSLDDSIVEALRGLSDILRKHKHYDAESRQEEINVLTRLDEESGLD